MKILDEQLLGRKILKLRKRRGLTQEQLAEETGLSQSAIRSYELGDRNPKSQHLEKIAQVLDVRPEAFTGLEVMTNDQAIHMLFRLDESGRLEPTEIDGVPCLIPASRNKQISRAMQAWVEKENEFQEGQLAPEEYEEWKDSFSI